jgi:hypothetical protein
MTHRVIELKEWETREVRLDDADVAALIAHPQRPAVVEPSPSRGFWRLRAQAKVGAVRFEGFDLIIRPKAGLQNVFYLMGIERPRDWWSNDEVDLLVHHDLFAGIARLLAHTIERAIGRGFSMDTSNVASVSSPSEAGLTSGSSSAALASPSRPVADTTTTPPTRSSIS